MLGFIIVAGLWGFGNFGHFSFGPTQNQGSTEPIIYYDAGGTAIELPDGSILANK